MLYSGAKGTMKLQRESFEEHFREYRKYLSREIYRFCDSATVYRQVDERTQDHLAELNLAPGFFRTVQDSLFTTMVLWADKLFDEKGERGLFNFLTLIEYNRAWMKTTELQRRQNYPDGHWMLQNRTPITVESIEQDRQTIRGLSVLKSVRIRRDKFHGHFDKDYFFDRGRFKMKLHCNGRMLTRRPASWAESSTTTPSILMVKCFHGRR